MPKSNTTIRNSQFLNNTGKQWSSFTIIGPFDQNYGDTSLEIENSTFIGNIAANRSGALSIGRISVANINNCRFQSNIVTSYYGGSITYEDGGSLTIRNTVFSDDYSTKGGSNIYLVRLKR